VTTRRVALLVAVVAVVSAVTWVLWPTTSWPRTFCAPVARVVGADVNRLDVSLSHPRPAFTAAQATMVATLRHDVRLSEAAAPTPRLRVELATYLAQLRGTASTGAVANALSQFDEHARTQLRACGITPIGS
jgi:hypothetical protein